MVADMPKKSYRVVLWALAAFGLCADQVSKYAIFSWLAPVENNHYWLFKLDAEKDTGFQLLASSRPAADGSYVPRVNTGALFGLGQDEAWANNAFAVISVVAAGAILYWSLRKGAARSLWVCVALGLILAGTLGNLYDRVVFHGVRDFLHWNYLYNWPVFNIADSCLVVGAGLLLLQAFGRQAKPADAASPVDSASAAVPAAAARRGSAPAAEGIVRKTAV
jgi:lipoprotein signal peptidase